MVSVIIPVYNGAAMIEQCLQSILNQSCTDLEIIVVDDGSTDNTNAICYRIAQEDARVLLLTQKNAGVSAARNKGIANARGEYIAFVDADDYLPEKGIELMLAAVSNNTDLVVGSYEEFRRGYSKRIIREEIVFSPEMITERFEEFDALMNTVWAKLYKKQIINQFEIRFDNLLPYSEDHVFNLEYCKRIRNAALISGMVYCYRLGGVASSIKYYPQWNRFCLLLMDAYANFFDGNDKIPSGFYKRKISTQFISSVAHYMIHCSSEERDQKLQETLTMFEPFFQKEMMDEYEFSPLMAKAILSEDIKGIMRVVRRKMGARIIMRKAKIKYYQSFNKRI